jgi:hypothetical protein
VYVAAEIVLRKTVLLVFGIVGQVRGAEEVERVHVVLASGPLGMILYHYDEIGSMWMLALVTSYSKLLVPQH